MKSLTHCFVSRVLFIGILVVWANQLSTSGANTISGEQSDTRNGPWTLDRSPYVVVDDITVPEGETLTIEAGVEVRFESDYWLDVYGSLSAAGTQDQPITFTSDRKYPGDWKGIYFEATAGASTMAYCVVEFGGSDGDWGSANITIDGASNVTLSGLTCRSGGNDGVVVMNAANPTIEDCVFENNRASAIAVESDSYPVLHRNTATGHGSWNGIAVVGGHIEVSGIWYADTMPYVVDRYRTDNGNGNRDIAAEATLTIEPGTIIKFQDVRDCSFNVYGTLIAEGTAQQPIVFTSITDDGDEGIWGDTNSNGPSRGKPGDWEQIAFEPESHGSILRHCTFYYGGEDGRILYLSTDNIDLSECTIAHSEEDGLEIEEADPDISNLFIHDNLTSGIRCDNASPTIEDCLIQGNADDGIGLTDSSPVVRNNIIRGNYNGIWLSGNCDPTISGNDISGSIDAAIHASRADDCIDARDNWWGNSTGPFDDSDDSGESCGDYNPSGLGGRVTDNLRYRPWRQSPAGESQIVGVWHFESSESNTAIDTSGQNNDGNISGAVRVPLEEGGQALSFDGVDDYVSIPFRSINHPEEEISLSCWLKIEQHGDMPVISSFRNGGYRLRFESGSLVWEIQVGQELAAVRIPSYDMTAHRWHYVTGTYDGRNVRIYLDGLLKEERPAAGSISYSAQNAIILGGYAGSGANPPNQDGFFHGFLDQVRLRNHAISPAQMLGEAGIHVPKGAGKEPTEITDDITEDTVWRLEDSPYYIARDRTLSSEVTLTIEPGVVVLFRSANLGLFVDGTLIANEVTFTARDALPEPGTWDALEFNGGSSGSRLTSCVIKYGGAGGDYGNIQVFQASPEFSWCTFSESSGPGAELSGSQSVFADCIIRDNQTGGIHCSDASSPTIRDCRFINNGRTMVQELDCFPVFEGANTSEITSTDGSRWNGILVERGDFETSGSWNQTFVPYILENDVTIKPEARLTIGDRVIIKFDPRNVGIEVEGGTLQAHGVTFTSLKDDFGGDTNGDGPSDGTPGDWDSLEFSESGSDSVLENCVVRFAGGYGGNENQAANIQLYDASPQILRCQVEYSELNGIHLVNSESVIDGCVIQYNAGRGIRCIAGSRPTIRDCHFTDNERPIFYELDCFPAFEGTLTSNITSADGSRWNGIQVGRGDLTEDVRWTQTSLPYILTGDVHVLPGITLELVEGVTVKFRKGNVGFEADGTFIARRATFTSLKDDLGGDTNGDGSRAQGDPRDWDAVELHTDDSKLIDCVLRFAGYNGTEANVQIYDSSPSIENCVMEHSGGDGMQIKNASPSVKNCRFTENERDGILVENPDSGGLVELLDCDFTGNHRDGVRAIAAQVNLRNCTILNNGDEHANVGTGIAFRSESTGVIENCVIRGNGPKDGILLDGSEGAEIRNCTISLSGDDGIDADGANAVISGCDISGNLDDGIDSDGSSLDITKCIIRDNGTEEDAAGLTVHGSRDALPVITDSLLVNNHGYGVYNSTSADVEAKGNWWGYPSGPYHDELNPFGGGNAVTDHVLFKDFKTTVTGEPPQIEAELQAGQTLATRFTSNKPMLYYRISVPAGKNLKVTLNDADDQGVNHLYLRHGDFPSLAQFDHRHKAPGADQQVFVPAATAGDWYLLVYQFNSGGSDDFTIDIEVTDITLFSVTPTEHGNAADIVMTVQGAGFGAGTGLELTSTTGTFPATSTEVDSYTQLTATFTPGSVSPGLYTIRVTAPGNEPAELTNAFDVLQGGEPRLETNLIIPSQVGYHQVATIYVEYANTGEIAIPAPLLIVTAEQTGEQRALMTLDKSRVTRGFWTSAVPQGFAHTIQILASGATPGILNPGESKRVPVYYVGWLRPWDTANYPPIEFGLASLTRANANPVPWNSLKNTLQPQEIAAEAWDIIWSNFVERTGSTWGDFVGMVSENATHLGRLGIRVLDVQKLTAFELIQASEIGPLSHLALAEDLHVETPGIPLNFTRTFPAGIVSRFRRARFGWGWMHNWDYQVVESEDGRVTILTAGRARHFEPDSRIRGKFFSPSWEMADLSGSAGNYTLQEPNGIAYQFNSGRFDYAEDQNGNRVTAIYSADRLTGLSHSSGLQISIFYNGSGLIERIQGPYGRESQYRYDSGNQHLIQVLLSNGTSTSYGYGNPSTSTAHHALHRIEHPNSSVQTYAYDGRGLLTAISGPQGNRILNLSYPSTGLVRATDALENESEFYFDHRGILSKRKDPLGSFFQAEYGASLKLKTLSWSNGESLLFDYDNDGNLTELISPSGDTTDIQWTSRGKPMRKSDPLGNQTAYRYDVNGNLAEIQYADATRETFEVDAEGNRVKWTNRRSQEIEYSYDSVGRPTVASYPNEPADSYMFDDSGNLAVAARGAREVHFEYDSKGRVNRITYPNDRFLEYEYNQHGERSLVRDHLGGETIYSYDEAGQLSKISDETGRSLVSYEYDSTSHLTRSILGNGITTDYRYDPVGRLAGITHSASDGTERSHFQYVYNSLGQRVSTATKDGIWQYSYTANGALKEATFQSSIQTLRDQNLIFQYDAMGNRIGKTANGVLVPYTVDKMNRYSSVGGNGRGYDADGNQVQKSSMSEIWNFTYDANNRLVNASNGTSSISYEYDALGQLWAEVKDGVRHEFLIDPMGFGNLVAVFGNQGQLIRRYHHGHGLVARNNAASDLDFFLFDGLGNTCQLAGQDGDILNSYSYLPFGEIQHFNEQTENMFGFSGQFGARRSAAGLVHLRARFYDPEDGRFLTEDPVRWLIGNNRNYANGDPVNSVDPQGMVSANTLNFTGGVVTIIGGVAIYALSPIAAVPTAVAVGGYGIYKVLATVSNYAKGDENYLSTNFFEDATFHIPKALGFDPLSENSVWGAKGLDLAFGLISAPTHWLITQANNLLTLQSVWPYFYNAIPNIALALENIFDYFESLLAQSQDPNQKLGPAGYSLLRFIRNEGHFTYRVDFENYKEASAPAQVVQITDPLDADLDPSTFELTEVGFGDHLIPVPANTQHFQHTEPMTFNGKDFDVQIDIRLNPSAGEITALFSSIDPLVGLPPPVDIGFLPPEDETGRGQGYFAYVIKPKNGLPTGTDIRNIATITFDFGEVIDTNQNDPHDKSKGTDPEKEAFNTIDADRPTSRVLALSATSDNPTFKVQWDGEDGAGSGVRAYTIFVRDQNGPFVPWLVSTPETSAQFSGTPGHTYDFYSIAIDNVNFEENAKSSAESTTTVAGQAPGGKAPQITMQPQSLSVTAGDAVEFRVAASGTGPFTYLWKHNNQPISGATSATLQLSSVTAADAGEYMVVVSNAVGPVESQSAVLTVQIQPIGEAFAVRRLPPSYIAGVPLEVIIDSKPPNHALAYGLEEQPPASWAVSDISHSGTYDAVNGKIKWTFLNNTPIPDLTYRVTPPSTQLGNQCFSGTGDVNGVEVVPIGGVQCLDPASSRHPADFDPSDWRLIRSEVLAYATAYRRGNTWPTEPNPIPLPYVIRGLVLYKNGEQYRIDESIGTAPTWWINDTVTVASPAFARATVLNVGSSAVSSIPQEFEPGVSFTVTIQVTPAQGGVAYGVEDQPPAGWIVSAINESGEYDSINHKVKWTFLDNQARSLSYDVTSPQDAEGSVMFTGLVSFDGAENKAIEGNRSTKSTTASAPQISITIDASGKIVLTFDGALHSADDVAGPYAEVPGVVSPLTISPVSTSQFYKAVRQ